MPCHAQPLCLAAHLLAVAQRMHHADQQHAPEYTYDAQAAGELYRGLQQVYAAAAKLNLPDATMRFLNQFRKQPEVDEAIRRWKTDTQ